MRKVALLLLVLVTAVSAGGFKRNALTMSIGVPGLILPEFTYEFSFDASNKIGIGVGSFGFWSEYRLNYTRMLSSFELTGSVGYVPNNGNDDEDEGFLDGLFESILSDGTTDAKFISATGGYRYTADGGFIFRAAGGGGYFFNDEDSRFIPFLQLGVGYAF